MTPEEMKARTKAYALRVIRVVQSLPPGHIGDVLGRQLLRAGTSVAANYRAVCRARSRADFVNKWRPVEEECDESLFWMELLVEGGLVRSSRLAEPRAEGNAILAIAVASAKTARAARPTVNRQS